MGQLCGFRKRQGPQISQVFARSYAGGVVFVLYGALQALRQVILPTMDHRLEHQEDRGRRRHKLE